MMRHGPDQDTRSAHILQKCGTSEPSVPPGTEEKKMHAKLPAHAPAFNPQHQVPRPPLLSSKLLVRMVPWPADAGRAPLNVGQEALWHMAADPLSLVRMAYGLFYLPGLVAEDLLRLTVSAAHEALVVDFKCAERNLELPAVGLVSFLPGLRCAARAAFMKTGGLEGLVFRMGLPVIERRTLLAGAAVMLRLRAR